MYIHINHIVWTYYLWHDNTNFTCNQHLAKQAWIFKLENTDIHNILCKYIRIDAYYSKS